ncbi:flavodoxin family protein [Streptomyces sp. NPDC058067]|uniref:flavodoxin family protein n=1 Tax=Streptomyces sp. NPDC058067 TaxID=3346324 RepID=UPI0036E6D529
MSRTFLFLLGSSRGEGNTEILARRAAEQLSPDVGQRWISLAEHPLPDFEDLRHDSDHTRPSGDNTALLLDATLEATDIVIASPLYWYSVSGHAKRYLDHWSGWLRTPGLDFKATLEGRTLWGVTALAHEEQVVADPLVGTLRNSAAYMGMRFGGVLFGNGSKPGDVLRDEEALLRAKTFFTPEREPEIARFPYEA